MLMILITMIFMTPLCFMKKTYWMVQNLLFMLSLIFMFNGTYTYQWENLSYFLGCDLLSFGLVLLTFWVISLMLMASSSIINMNYYYNLFLFLIIMLMMLLYLTFSSMNFFLFYLFFEASLIPTLLLILGWGYQPERLQAGIYLLFYTLLASLPLLVGIFYIYLTNWTLFFMFFNSISYSYLYMYMCMVMAFLVKMPMFLVHLWLPKAHVEAPVSGSMILAGIMLKLGGYGLLRSMILVMGLGVSVNYIWISISLVGGVLVSLLCLRQIDLKSLIAYSSVAHMGVVLGGLLTLTYWGCSGSYLMMIAHGLCSSGLFCLANISYERLGSRSLLINKGLINFMPSMSLWWFLLSSSNMAAPPSLNLLSEIMLLNSLISWNLITMLMLSLLSFFSAAYTLYMYSYTQHGKIYSGLYSSSQGYIREYLLLFLHWFPLNILILKSEFFTLWL
uniref:NADH-ubiquinone oxidoreductase chain 4 n=1 Tax=Macroxyela ferruginea TaxID=48208 RepID=A0A6G5ZU67_9HYME|nr:NADH dehydrogenase subunit 4 [Macroxyela ferruginea]QHR79728.1 NADH dehydrogenase subunit 4 [Macroxyela ferruginea]